MSVIWHIFINMYTIHYIRKGRLWYCTNSAGPPHINVASISVNGRLNAWGGVRLIPLREGWSDQISQNPGIAKEGEGGPLPCPYHSLISFEFLESICKKGKLLRAGNFLYPPLAEVRVKLSFPPNVTWPSTPADFTVRRPPASFSFSGSTFLGIYCWTNLLQLSQDDQIMLQLIWERAVGSFTSSDRTINIDLVPC